MEKPTVGQNNELPVNNNETLSSPKDSLIEEQDIRSFTKEYSPWARYNLAEKIKIARIRQRLGESSKEEITDEIEDQRNLFYQRFQFKKENFDRQSKERDIGEISEKYDVMFIHSLPTEGVGQWNTEMNNKIVNTKNLSAEDKIDLILKNKPDLSCSTIFREESEETKEGANTTMYPFGLVIRGGKVLSAYSNDAGTISESGLHKKSKYDQDTKDTSIQDDIEYRIRSAITKQHENKGERRKYYSGTDSGRNINEFVVEEPKIDGLFVDLDHPSITSYDQVLDNINKLVSSYNGIPVYIREKGVIKIYSFKNNCSDVEIVDSPEKQKSLKDFEKIFTEKRNLRDMAA